MDFHRQSTWESYDPHGHARQRLRYVRALIPPEVKTILDVGCGNGILTNALAETYAVTGVDPSPAALSYVRGTKFQASIEELPFGDWAFDLVSCFEVLEHLSPADFDRGIGELMRVARSYLLIGVPNREQLGKKLSLCARCGHIEHVHGHLRSFTPGYLDELFSPDYERVRYSIFGPRERDFPARLLRLLQNQGQWFAPAPGAVCAACGGDDFLRRSTLATKLLNSLNHVVSLPRPYWLLSLYRRREW